MFSRFKALMIMISSSYLISKLCFETRSPSQVVFNTFISFFKLSQTYIFPSYNRLNVNLSYKLLNVQFPKLKLSSIYNFPSYNRLNVNLSCNLLMVQCPKLKLSPIHIFRVATAQIYIFRSCNLTNVYFPKFPNV